MKFSEFITKNTTFWTDNFPTLPSTVCDLVNEYFYYRDLCDNTRFYRYFKSKINLKLDEFLTLYNEELEFRKIDPFEIEEIERTINTVKNTTVEDIINSIKKITSDDVLDKNLSNSEELDLSNSVNDDNLQTLDKTNTRDLTDVKKQAGTDTFVKDVTFTNLDKKTGEDNINTSNTGTNTTTNTGDTTNITNETNTGTNKFNDYPQSDINPLTNYLSNQTNQEISNTGTNKTTDNTTQTLNLNNNTDTVNSYASNLSTSSNENDSSTNTKNLTDTITNTGTVKDTGTVADKRTVTGTNTGTVNNTQTGKETKTSSTNENFDKTDNNKEKEDINLVFKELRKGNFVDLYKKFYNIVANLNSVDWLVKQLDTCFIQVFDEDFDYSTTTTGGGGGGGGGNTDELEKQILALQNSINKINNELTEVNNSVTVIGTNLTEINPVINGLTPRSYNFNNSEPSGAGIGDIQVGTLLIYGDSVSNIQLYMRVSPLINTTSVDSLTGGVKVKVNNTSDYNLIKEYFTTVFKTFPPKNTIIENIPCRFFNNETYQMEYYSRKSVTLGMSRAFMDEGPGLESDDLWIGLNGSLDLDPSQENYIPNLAEFGYAGYLFKLV